MRKILLPIFISLFSLACTKSDGYQKADLKKLAWIEGNWRGPYEGKYFYETYKFENDSTLKVISYDWNGKDSSNTSVTKMLWKENMYFLGNEQNYKVTEIKENSVFMLPNNKASNNILWTYKSKDNWEAVLTSPKKKTSYLMERTHIFDRKK